MIYELVQTAMKQQLETMHTASDGEQKTLIETYLRKVNLSLDEIN